MLAGVIRRICSSSWEVPRIRGNLIVISGPSGSGRTQSLWSDRKFPIWPTQSGDYSSSAEARSMGSLLLPDARGVPCQESGGEFLETAEFCGNLYGTPRSFVEESWTRERRDHGHRDNRG